MKKLLKALTRKKAAPRTYKDIDDVVAHAKESSASNEFFSAESMKTWGCRLIRETYGEFGHVFITSERTYMPLSQTEERAYTVRVIDPLTGNITEQGSKFQQFPLLRDARVWAKEYAALLGSKASI